MRSMASSAARNPIPPDAMRRTRPQRSPKRARAGGCPSSSAAPGSTSRCCWSGLSPVPAIDPDVRAHWRAQAAQVPAPELHAILARRDPAMAARLMPTDPQRIVRALEVLESTGRSLADWQRVRGEPVLARGCKRCGCWSFPTARLARSGHRRPLRRHDECGRRSKRCGRCSASACRSELPIMRALGVAPLAAHIAGELALEEAVASAKAETRQYAKRQLTWLRRNMSSWKAIDTQYMERITRQIS